MRFFAENDRTNKAFGEKETVPMVISCVYSHDSSPRWICEFEGLFLNTIHICYDGGSEKNEEQNSTKLWKKP